MYCFSYTISFINILIGQCHQTAPYVLFALTSDSVQIKLYKTKNSWKSIFIFFICKANHILTSHFTMW